MIHEFQSKLSFSLGRRMDCDTETIRQMLPGCVSVTKTTPAIDKRGIDYIATLRRGALVYIDAKNRETGCSRWWRRDDYGRVVPELALEIWSVLPGGKYKTVNGKTGWTLNEASNVDMILFQFDKDDSERAYLLGFQPLRMSMVRYVRKWMQKYRVDTQDSNGWESQCVFVPAGVVLDAIKETCVLNRCLSES